MLIHTVCVMPAEAGIQYSVSVQFRLGQCLLDRPVKPGDDRREVRWETTDALCCGDREGGEKLFRLPGCVATGATVEAVERGIRAAIRFHIEGLKADGLAVPAATSIADYVDA